MPPKRGGKAPAFPAARVKRIMQQDDEVGKVATASPIVMAKATELFLQEMLTAIEREARASSTKKVSMYHVKRAVDNTPSLDFLKDLVSTIPDPTGAEEDYDSSEKPAKKRTARSAADKAAAPVNGSASPASNISLSATASTSASASGLKKIKISHNASGLASASTSGLQPQQPISSTSSTMPMNLPPMPVPQEYSGPKVAIPISSLLSEPLQGYDQEAASDPFGTKGEPSNPPFVYTKTEGDDAVKSEDQLADTTTASATELSTNANVSAEPATGQAASTISTAYRREEDEDYDDEE